MSAEHVAAHALAGLDDRKPAAEKSKRRGPRPKIKFPKEPTVIQTIPRRKEYVNHTYRDFSDIPREIGHETPTDIKDMSFSEKVHHMLSEEEYNKYITWMPHGRSFRIAVPIMFEKHICEKYFGHKRYSSFLRQLNNHGFKHLTKGQDRNCYYNECFLRGMVHLCKYMPEPKDARRQIPDPENEPSFAAISAQYPVPDIEGNRAAPVVAAAPVTKPTAATVAPAAAATAPVPVAAPVAAQQQQQQQAGNQKGMDRSAALAEINLLRSRLASEFAPSPSSQPVAKRQALAAGLMGQTPLSQLSRMPQFFPTRGVSQVESLVQRNAMIKSIRQQQQEQKELQMQEKLKEMRAQRKLEQIQAQQQMQEFQAQKTLQDLRACQAVNEFEKQQAMQELEQAKAAQQQQQLQALLQSLQQPQQQSSETQDPAAALSDLLGLRSQLP